MLQIEGLVGEVQHADAVQHKGAHLVPESITLFEKMPILQALTVDDYRNPINSGHIQLKLFES
jgi:hypothetical protein